MANFRINLHGRSLLERALLGIAALAVFVVLFFFLAAGLVLGTIAVVAILARAWWFKRTLKRPEQTEAITAEYTVIEREPPAQPRLPDEIRPGSSKDT